MFLIKAMVAEMVSLFQVIETREQVLGKILSICRQALRQSRRWNRFVTPDLPARFCNEHTKIIVVQMLQYELLRQRLLFKESRKHCRISKRQRKKYERYVSLYEKYTKHLIKRIVR